MEPLLDLWLPIVVSAVIVFVASFLAWMVLPHHKADWKGLPDEDTFNNMLRSTNINPGQYMFPYCSSSKDMKSEAFKERWKAGPRGTLCVWSGTGSMGLNLFWVFVFYLVVGIFVGYLTTLACEPGAAYMAVFRVAGTVAIMAYTLATIPNAIWFRTPLRSIVMNLVDGIAYGLLTAGTFAALWPEAATSAGV